jgi:hypothetical protein
MFMIDTWDDPWDLSLPYQDCGTIDGGQICMTDDPGHELRGLQCIASRRRRFYPGPVPMIESVDNPSGKSEVLGWIDTNLLPHPEFP